MRDDDTDPLRGPPWDPTPNQGSGSFRVFGGGENRKRRVTEGSRTVTQGESKGREDSARLSGTYFLRFWYATNSPTSRAIKTWSSNLPRRRHLLLQGTSKRSTPRLRTLSTMKPLTLPQTSMLTQSGVEQRGGEWTR